MTLANIIKPERKARSCPESRENIAMRGKSLMRRPIYMRKQSLMRTPFPYELTEGDLNYIVRTLEENNLLRGALKPNRNYSNVAGRTRCGRCARCARYEVSRRTPPDAGKARKDASHLHEARGVLVVGVVVVVVVVGAEP